MRYAKGISFLLILLFGVFLPAQPSRALDIPTLNWERGKTLSVVLGGYPENLGWDIYLEGESIDPFKFSRSSVNSSNFVVYTISLPRDLEVGQYRLQARNSSYSATLVAVVQVVERFQYNILEIPRDLIFVLTSFLAVLSMQLILRTWYRREVRESLFSKSEENYVYSKSGLGRALIAQRIRWKDKWMGRDYLPSDISISPMAMRATLPLIALIISLYSAVNRNWQSFHSEGNLVFLALLVGIGIWDRYSAKLATISLFSAYIIFNVNLNFPSLLGFGFLLSMLFLPQYVGDLTRDFLSKVRGGLGLRSETTEGISALTSGISIFWLYLMGESVTLAGDTDASRLTPVALVASICYFYRNLVLRAQSFGSTPQFNDELRLLPVISLTKVLFVIIFSFSTVISWTANFLVSFLSTLLFTSTLILIHLVPKSIRFSRNWWLRNNSLHLFLVMVFAGLSFYISKYLPFVVQGRSELLLVALGIPILLLGVVQFIFTSDRKLNSLGDLKYSEPQTAERE